MGLARVWLVDPQRRTLHSLTDHTLNEVASFVLPELEFEIRAADIF